MCSLGDMFVYNMGDGKPRYIVGQVRLDGEKRALAVAAIFPLEVSEAEARQLHSAEMAHAGGLQLRKGTKQKADTLMLETPMKKVYRVGTDDA